jgi:hypothetical protein
MQVPINKRKMILKLTNKLSQKLKIKSLNSVNNDSNPYSNWSSNLFLVNNKQYILFSNDLSLFSFLIEGAEINNKNKILPVFREKVKHYLEEYCLCFETINNEIVFGKLENKSLIASMNNIVQVSKSILGYQKKSISESIDLINGIPFKSLNFKYPRDVFKEIKNRI